MRWTPDGTIRNALWIGGGQWAGKTTVAALLTERHGLVHYHYDFHDARGHEDRRIAARVRRGELTAGTNANEEEGHRIAARPRPGELTADTNTGEEDERRTAAPPHGKLTTDNDTGEEEEREEGRRIAGRLPCGELTDREEPEPDGDEMWIRRTPEEMAARVIAGFRERFGWVLDDLRGIVTPHPVVADGWGLRPELVAEVADPARMVLLVPTDGWRRHQAAALPRARRVGATVSDPELAARNRVERDRLVAEDAVRQGRRLGVRVIEVDGSRPAGAVAGEVADHFARFLPDPAAYRGWCCGRVADSSRSEEEENRCRA